MAKPSDILHKTGAAGPLGPAKPTGPLASGHGTSMPKPKTGEAPPKSTTPKSQRGGGGNQPPASGGGPSKLTGVRPKV